ncbi:MAG: 1-deoxy-D-xylulose-5-phosphate synthase [Proteobacteria bacterium]|nr:1-deoxy-D-xylulose-5-phosphate synthase [Pseudomonadota bacterium]
MRLLNTIDSPKDLKHLSRSDLKELAIELRERIVDVVSRNGGHLASSLGAVELAIAIHYVFDIPADKLIWDVGHQAYAHKLLTGRNKDFDSLRKHGGISGFPKLSESAYDAFSTGHSGTSISAGFGMSAGKCLKKEKNKVIAVIGDGSMTSGIAYEGLNQAGVSKKNLIVILNDNDMSISPNVGALSSFLSRKLSSKYIQDLRKEFKNFLKKLPMIGDDVYNIAKRSEDSFKTFVTPGMLFEAFNFDYFGSIDGHNLDQLIDILVNIKELREPALLHIITQKGKGYLPAEKNPVYFHGVSSFEKVSGNKIKKPAIAPTYTQVFGETMQKLGQKYSEIVAVTAAMPEGTGLQTFSNSFPGRFFDVGIAEQHGVTFAAGLATEGFIPVVAIYSTFLQRAYDQIVHDVALESLPVIFAIDRGGIVGEDGPTHHGLFDFAYLRNIPNMVIMAPKDENELSQMLHTAVKYRKGPIAIRYPRGQAVGVPVNDCPESIDIGRAEILTHGNDVLILAIGKTVQDALDAYEDLKENYGIQATVVNTRFVKPMDSKLICDLVEKIPKVITVEEHMLDGGFGSAVIECLIDQGITRFNLKRIGIKDLFVEHGSQQILRTKYGIDPDAIVQAAKNLLTG